MGLIKKASELEFQPTVNMMIYGQAGMGKTTLALSSPSPLLLDFDNGVKRVNDLHLEGVDVVQVKSWGEVEELIRLHRGELAGYGTIVVDTVGKMVECAISGVCGGRQPKLQDWGKINQTFQWFCRELRDLGKNVIFVAHRDTRKEGDETVFVPSLREKNYNAIVTELDLLGYLEMRSDRGQQVRTITFDPTNRNDGKNTCQLPAVMNIPEVVDRQGHKVADNDFIGREIISHYCAMLKARQETHRRHVELMTRIGAEIAGLSDAAGVNDYIARLKEMDHAGSSLQKARVLLSGRINKLGLKLDAATKMYVDGAGN